MSASISNVPPNVDTARSRRVHQHENAKQARSERFSKQIYGVVQQPIIPKNVIGVWDPPSYLTSQRTCKHINAMAHDGIDRKLDLRCFYTGVICRPFRLNGIDSTDPKTVPWLGSRDHLVPMRRDVLHTPVNPGNYSSALVWSSHMANTVFGLTPFLVKMKIRQWMMTLSYDRNHLSVQAGHNVKWIIVNLLDEFRLNGRYPWSRKSNGEWWYPEISIPFMNRMWSAEKKFLELSDTDRDKFIQNFAWQF